MPRNSDVFARIGIDQPSEFKVSVNAGYGNETDCLEISSCCSCGQRPEEIQAQHSTKHGCKILAFNASGISEVFRRFWCTFIGTAEGWVSGAALRGEVTPSHRCCEEARNSIAGYAGEFACINIFMCKIVSGIIRGVKRSLWSIHADLASGASFSITCRFCISSNSSREIFDLFQEFRIRINKIRLSCPGIVYSNS